MTCIQLVNAISTLVLSYLIIKLVQKILNHENSSQFLGCEAYIQHIETETKFDAKDEGKHATISKIEGKLKSGKCTIESKIEGKLKSENIRPEAKSRESSSQKYMRQ